MHTSVALQNVRSYFCSTENVFVVLHKKLVSKYCLFWARVALFFSKLSYFCIFVWHFSSFLMSRTGIKVVKSDTFSHHSCDICLTCLA